MTWRAISARPYEMSSTYNTSARLHDKFQNLRYVITERVVNNAPVWATEDGVHFMYRSGGGRMIVGGEESCAAGKSSFSHHTTFSRPRSCPWRIGRATAAPRMNRIDSQPASAATAAAAAAARRRNRTGG
jgi:hypothetical protein